ncbi:MAG: hypothetical protein ACRYHQ_18745, partial [Janthinobacterium lividum]
MRYGFRRSRRRCATGHQEVEIASLVNLQDASQVKVEVTAIRVRMWWRRHPILPPPFQFGIVQLNPDLASLDIQRNEVTVTDERQRSPGLRLR